MKANPEIIDCLERYCQVSQTMEEREECLIVLEPTNIYTKQTLYLPFNHNILKKYLHSELIKIQDTHEISFSYGLSLYECLFS